MTIAVLLWGAEPVEAAQCADPREIWVHCEGLVGDQRAAVGRELVPMGVPEDGRQIVVVADILKRPDLEQGRGGHYVKSRAAQVQIASCSFDDTGGRETNYIIDLPAGATGQITNNWFVQGTSKENRSALIAVGAEDLRHTSDGLEISGNDARLAPRAQPTVFVADWTGQRLNIGQNKLGQGLTRYERR